jgi:hypothetical protein
MFESYLVDFQKHSKEQRILEYRRLGRDNRYQKKVDAILAEKEEAMKNELFVPQWEVLDFQETNETFEVNKNN